MTTILRRCLDRIHDQELFLTHTAGDWCAPGQEWTHRDGRTFRITRVVPQARTRLLNSGSAACAEVRGVPA